MKKPLPKIQGARSGVKKPMPKVTGAKPGVKKLMPKIVGAKPVPVLKPMPLKRSRDER